MRARQGKAQMQSGPRIRAEAESAPCAKGGMPAEQRTVAFKSARDDFGDNVLTEVNHVLEREAQEKRYRRFFRGAAAVAAGGR